LPRARSVRPLGVPGGTRKVTTPSSVGTRRSVPSTASAQSHAEDDQGHQADSVAGDAQEEGDEQEKPRRAKGKRTGQKSDWIIKQGGAEEERDKCFEGGARGPRPDVG